MGKRAQRRRRGQRKEAERNAAKALAKEQGKMWRKLSNTEHNPKLGYHGTMDTDAGYFYCPYVPIIRTGSFIIGDTTA